MNNHIDNTYRSDVDLLAAGNLDHIIQSLCVYFVINPWKMLAIVYLAYLLYIFHSIFGISFIVSFIILNFYFLKCKIYKH